MNDIKTLAVKRITRQSNRTLIYGDDPGFYIIAPKEYKIEEGQSVKYEPYGVNFGFLAQPSDSVDRG